MSNVFEMDYTDMLEAAIFLMLEDGIEPHELSELANKKIQSIWRGLLAEKSESK